MQPTTKIVTDYAGGWIKNVPGAIFHEQQFYSKSVKNTHKVLHCVTPLISWKPRKDRMRSYSDSS